MRDALLAQGHDVTVFTGEEYLTATGSRHEIDRLAGASLLIEKLRARLGVDAGDGGMGAAIMHHAASTLVRAGVVDLIEMEESFGWATRVMRVGAPVVLRLHGPHFVGREPIETDAQRAVSDRRCHTEGAALRSASGVTSPSARLLECTSLHYTLDQPTRAIFNPQTVPVARWNRDQVDESQILCIGRFDLRKGADLILEAFSHVLRSNIDARLIMVGPDNGVRLTSGEVKKFSEYVADYPPTIKSRITHLGPLTSDVIEQLRLRSAMAVVASRFETFSYVLAESMAYGMPVITTDLFGTGEMVDDGKTGVVVQPDNVKELASAITFMLNHQNQALLMGQNARRWVKENLSPAKIAAKTTDFYSELI